jgi:adenosylhomocysteine nucleosidase
VGLAAEARIALRLGWPVAIGGGTPSGADMAAQKLIDDGVTALVSFGLAGGLDPALPAGTIIVSSAVLDGDHRYPTDPELSGLLGGATPHEMLGANMIVATVAKKARLHSDTGAAATDLESAAVGRVAKLHSLPFAVMRVICDPAQCALPPAALVPLTQRGSIAIGRVLTSILVHPTQIPALLSLAFYAMTARRALLVRVKQMISGRA